MTLSAQQYVCMRALFRGALAANSLLYANPSDGEVLSFFLQLTTEASSASALGSAQQAAIGYAFRGLLSGNFPGVSNPSDADVLAFWTQIGTDSAGAAALAVPRYNALKQTLLDSVALNYPGTTNPTAQQLLGYITTVAPSFNGDFGALFTGYGLTVRSYRRGDLGVTGTTGSGFSSWANQAGDGSAMTPGAAASSNGVGSVGAGLNGKASVTTNGVSQNGSYTHPTGPAPGTTNHHIYAVERILVTPVSQAWLHSANSAPVVFVAGAQVSPAAEMIFGNGVQNGPTSGVVNNQWYRLRASFTDSASDVLRVGAHTLTVSATSGGTAIGTQWGFGSAYNGTVLVSVETLLLMHIEGPLATFLTAATDADGKARSFWTTAIEI